MGDAIVQHPCVRCGQGLAGCESGVCVCPACGQDPRAEPRLCFGCGYSLDGLREPVCPECGRFDGEQEARVRAERARCVIDTPKYLRRYLLLTGAGSLCYTVGGCVLSGVDTGVIALLGCVLAAGGTLACGRLIVRLVPEAHRRCEWGGWIKNAWWIQLSWLSIPIFTLILMSFGLLRGEQYRASELGLFAWTLYLILGSIVLVCLFLHVGTDVSSGRERAGSGSRALIYLLILLNWGGVAMWGFVGGVCGTMVAMGVVEWVCGPPRDVLSHGVGKSVLTGSEVVLVDEGSMQVPVKRVRHASARAADRPARGARRF